MNVLVTCGVCGLVEPAAGTGAGLACPRCGSRAVETVELPARPVWVDDRAARTWRGWRLDPRVDVVGSIRTGVGGLHWPMTCAV